MNSSDSIKEMIVTFVGAAILFGLTWMGKLDGTAFTTAFLGLFVGHKGLTAIQNLKSTKTVTTTTEATP